MRALDAPNPRTFLLERRRAAPGFSVISSRSTGDDGLCPGEPLPPDSSPRHPGYGCRDFPLGSQVLQEAEAVIAWGILNRMAEIGRPKSFAICL